MAFNADQSGMAIFLLAATLANAWFVVTSLQRVYSHSYPDLNSNTDDQIKHRFRLMDCSVLAMSLFDIPWVWLCMIQCWNNTLTNANALHQTNGNDSFGCRLMGWYSTFSLFAMMGCHNLVTFSVKNYYRSIKDDKGVAYPLPFLETTRGFLFLATSLLILSSLFASMPLIGEGYILTNGGFCYADFTDAVQCAIILVVVIVFLALSTFQWWYVGRREFVVFYVVFFVTWTLWIPAALNGVATGEEISSPYMIIGAIFGHGNALINPLLYGVQLYRILSIDGLREDSKMADPC